jgi:hypothetical protein
MEINMHFKAGFHEGANYENVHLFSIFVLYYALFSKR